MKTWEKKSIKSNLGSENERQNSLKHCLKMGWCGAPQMRPEGLGGALWSLKLGVGALRPECVRVTCPHSFYLGSSVWAHLKYIFTPFDSKHFKLRINTYKSSTTWIIILKQFNIKSRLSFESSSEPFTESPFEFFWGVFYKTCFQDSSKWV